MACTLTQDERGAILGGIEAIDELLRLRTHQLGDRYTGRDRLLADRAALRDLLARTTP